MSGPALDPTTASGLVWEFIPEGWLATVIHIYGAAAALAGLLFVALSIHARSRA